MKNPITIRFNLKTPSTVNSLILAKISFGYSIQQNLNKEQDNLRRIMKLNKSELSKYKQVIITTGITIQTEFFDRNQQIILGKIGEGLNPKLEQFKSDVQRVYDSLSKDESKQINPAYFKQQIQKVMFKIPIEKKRPQLKEVAPSNIADYVQWKVKQWEKNAPKSGYRNYERFVNWLKRFEYYKTMQQSKEEAPFLLNFETLDRWQIDEFVEWMIRQKKDIKITGEQVNYKVSYLSKVKEGFKQFVREARKDLVKVNPELNMDLDSLKKVTEKTDDIYLNEDYVKAIKNVSFPEDANPKLNIIRDLMIVHLNCGMRTEDFLSYQHIFKDEGKWYFEIISEKTDTRSKIPVYDQDVISIYKKYGNVLPTNQTYSNEYNKLIKIVCLKAGLTNEKIVKFKNPVTSKKDNVTKKVFAMVTARTMRKTMASRMIRTYNVPIIVCMAWTGHTTESSFRKYIRLEADEYYQIASEQMKKLVKI